MKYSNLFKGLMIFSVFFTGLSLIAYLENQSNLCAILLACVLFSFLNAILLPNSDKYTKDEY